MRKYFGFAIFISLASVVGLAHSMAADATPAVPIIGSTNRAVVQLGDTRQQIESKLGEARSMLGAGSRMLMNYPEGQIVLENGHATDIPIALQAPVSLAPTPTVAETSPPTSPISQPEVSTPIAAPTSEVVVTTTPMAAPAIAPTPPPAAIQANIAPATKPATPAASAPAIGIAAKPVASATTAKPAGSASTNKPAPPKVEPPPPDDSGFSIPSYAYVIVGLIGYEHISGSI